MADDFTKVAHNSLHRRNFLLASTACVVGAVGLNIDYLPKKSHEYVHPATRIPLDDSLKVSFSSKKIGDIDVYYREVGPRDGPVILLLHGFPSASHMFRNLFPLLATKYHLIAPDLPGFGNSQAPTKEKFDYTAEKIYRTIESLTIELGLLKYTIYGFDYGLAIGLKLAINNPEKIVSIISQNGNIYTEGLGQLTSAWQTYWKTPSAHNRHVCAATLRPEKIKEIQYYAGADMAQLAPDGYNLDNYYLSLPGMKEIQLDLIYDYKNIVRAYPIFQKYLRNEKPPLLVLWGRYDQIFNPTGADAYLQDSPHAKIHFLETGRFVLETHAQETASYVKTFMETPAARRDTTTSNPTSIQIKNDVFFHTQKG